MESIHIKKNIWDANLYDTNYSFVSKYGNSLVELLAPKQGEKILDLGCGTGDLANTIYEVGGDIVGVDKSETMVEQAIRKYPHIQFMVQDATDLDFHSQFDAVFSNAALHWVQAS
nr:class I SAM-dependent methyltransferase [Neobacillus mesonae]